MPSAHLISSAHALTNAGDGAFQGCRLLMLPVCSCSGPSLLLIGLLLARRFSISLVPIQANGLINRLAQPVDPTDRAMFR